MDRTATLYIAQGVNFKEQKFYRELPSIQEKGCIATSPLVF